VKEKNTVVVLTKKGVNRMVNEGCTASWHLIRNRARACAFVVCTRNGKHPEVEDREPHRSAFLIAKIKDVVPSPTAEGRWLIQFSEYAPLSIPDVWKKGNRNPVAYADLEELGIDPSTLEWETMPQKAESSAPIVKVSSANGRPHKGSSALTIPEAKKALALTFGVQPEAIEITIRG